MTEQPPFQILVVMISGVIHRFAEESEELTRKNLISLKPEALYAQDTLTIGGTHSATAFRTSAIMRIEVMAEPRPKWAFAPRVESARLLSAPEFETKVEERARVDRAGRLVGEGQNFVGLASFEDTRGERFFVEIVGESAPTSVTRNVMRRILSAPLHVEREGADLLFNPAHLESVQLIPGPPHLPSGSLSASRQP